MTTAIEHFSDLKQAKHWDVREMSQEELYHIARAKQYYVPASKASAEEMQHVKSLFTSSVL